MYLSGFYKNLDLNAIAEVFHKKMAFKGHIFTGIDQLLNPENDKQLKAAWKNSLGHQISGQLPDYEFVKGTLKEWFSLFL